MALFLRLILFLGILVSIGTVCATEGQKDSSVQERTSRLVSNINRYPDYKNISYELESYFKDIDQLVRTQNNKLKNNLRLTKKINQFDSIFIKNKVYLEKAKDRDVIRYANYLKENGMAMGYKEGFLYLYFDYDYLYRRLKNAVPDTINEYFLIESDFQKEELSEDGALVIPWDRIRLRIIRLEGYLHKINKLNCSYIDQSVKSSLSSYIKIYFNGLQNDTDICSMVNEARVSYELFLKENKTSRYYDIVKGFYSDLKRNNFHFLSEKVPIPNTKSVYIVKMKMYDSNNQLVDVDQVIDNYLIAVAFDKGDK